MAFPSRLEGEFTEQTPFSGGYAFNRKYVNYLGQTLMMKFKILEQAYQVQGNDSVSDRLGERL